MSLDTRWEDVDTLLQRTTRTQDEKLGQAIQEIIAQRFRFPTPEHPAYRAHSNIPAITMAVQVGEEQIAPDIVVVEKLNTGETHVIMTAAIANHEMVNEGEARSKWARYSAIPDQAFYLYVPVGYGAQAKKLCKQLKLKVEGYRTWRTTPRGFEINDVSEAPSALAALMPGFVRKALATP